MRSRRLDRAIATPATDPVAGPCCVSSWSKPATLHWMGVPGCRGLHRFAVGRPLGLRVYSRWYGSISGGGALIRETLRVSR
jgi:hypothetical protein